MFSVLLLLFGLIIARAALMGAPDLDDLVHWEGRISSIDRESVTAASTATLQLRVALDGEERVFFIHPKGVDLDEIEKGLEVGTHISAWVEPHARQIFAGTPLARGRTEAWQVIVDQGSATSNAAPLLAFEDSAKRRRRDRAGWGLASGAALLIGAFGLSQWRRDSTSRSD